MRIIVIIIFLISPTVHSACWKVADFKGYSAKQGASYKIDEDGLTGQEFSVQMTGKGSAVIPSNDLQCTQIATYSIVCLFSEEGRGTVETWSVDPKERVAYFTKSNNGYGMFDGPVLFVGKIKGQCQ